MVRLFLLLILIYPALLWGQPRLVLPVGCTQFITAIAVSPDGQRVLSGGQGDELILWDVNSGVEVRRFEGTFGTISKILFSPNGKFGAVATSKGKVLIVDPADGKTVFSLELPDSRGKYIQYLAFSNDGQRVYSKARGMSGNEVVGWNINTGAVCSNDNLNDIDFGSIGFPTKYDHNPISESDFVKNVILKKDRSKESEWDTLTTDIQKVYGEYADKNLNAKDVKGLFGFLNDSKKQAENHAIPSFEALSINGLEYSPNKNFAITSSIGRIIKVWDLQSRTLVREIRGYTKPQIGVKFQAYKDALVTVSQGGSIHFWSSVNGMHLSSHAPMDDTISSVDFNSSGELIATGMESGKITIRNAKGQVLNAFKPFETEINRIGISDNGKFVAAHSRGFVILLNLESVKVSGPFEIKKSPHLGSFSGGAKCSAFVQGDSKLVIAGYRLLKVIDVEKGKVVKEFEIKNERGRGISMLSMAVTPDGESVAVGHRDGMRIVSLKNGKPVRDFAIQDADIYTIEFSDDGKTVYFGSKDNTIRSYDFNTGEIKKSFQGHFGPISSLTLLNDRQILCSASEDNTIRLWNIETGKLIATFIALADNGGAIVLPDQFYLATKKASRFLNFELNNEVFGFQQFDLRYNQPHKVLAALNFADEKKLEIYEFAYKKRLQKFGVAAKIAGEEEFHVPKILITNKDELPISTDKEIVTLSVKAFDDKYNLDRINVWVNDVPVFGIRGESIKAEATDNLETTYAIILSTGENKIQVSTLNEKGAESLKDVVYVNCTAKKEPPKTYYIGIGVSDYQDKNMNLTYAVKDVQDLQASLAKQYKNLVSFSLVNEEATRESILKLKSELLNTSVDDRVIVSFSGHGLLSENLDFYYATYDTDFSNPEDRGLLYDDIEWLLDSIPARKKLVLMDACHSGEVDRDADLQVEELADGVKGGKGFQVVTGNDESIGLQNSFELMQELFAYLSRGNGAVVISAAGGKEYAYEGEDWNNGVFTYSVLQAIENGKADKNRDKQTTVSELKDYVSTQVEALTGGRQKPTSRQENLEFDFRVW